jgi:gliding motility-associated-like protein
MKKVSLLLLLVIAFVASVSAQKKVIAGSHEYDQLKKSGQLNQSLVVYPKDNKLVVPQHMRRTPLQPNQTMSQHAQCNCMLPRDTSWSIVPFTIGTAPEYRNDDGSSPLITLPFNFNFYGTVYTDVYINNNGNISFNSPYFTFSANGFPDATHAMIAPFWADVDTRLGTGTPTSGLVYYKITPTSMIVQWDTVGYYGTHNDKQNTFQLIITDGTDPLLPTGNNVDFCYGDMNWTTGDASGGVSGFGGTPATVGANAGNGTDYVQFGQFDQPGYGYDGPFGANDSVDFLDNQNFIFNTFITGTTNIPPIVHGLVVCDTIIICARDTNFVDTIPVSLSFLSPEQGQITTITTSFSGSGSYAIINNIPGPIAYLDAEIYINSSSVGTNTLTVIATDNGSPVGIDSLPITFKLDTFPLAPPQIFGHHYYCIGGTGVNLEVPGNYVSYLWSNGATGSDSLQVLTGTYNCEITDRFGCVAKTPAFPVWEVSPDPIINGVTSLCGTDNAILHTTHPFDHYQWFHAGVPTGDTLATQTVLVADTGIYTVTVTDSIGCSATSPPQQVSLHPLPTANFSYSPLSALAGIPIQFTDESVAGSGTITGWLWNFGDSANSTSTLQNPVHTFDTLGSFTVTLTVTQSDGCTVTVSKTYEGQPEVVVPPNIFTPNGDHLNDYFSFKNLEFFPNSKLEVFNRWGKKVYENSNYDNKWNGGDVTDGVYYYVLKIPQKDVMKGTLTIKR